ncbi:MAG: orotidine-5'-phosphate decarboxylase [Acidobacteriia bacterium]|nr:orotidine-5'-phosphate decarboxylase [Terriglobia bacterium]
MGISDSARERLIVALDLSSAQEAARMVASLEGVVNFFKIGLTLQLAPGVEDLIARLVNSRKKVFLDYKYYDIPETVKTAVGRASDLGISFLTVHGSSNIIQKAVEGRGSSDLKLFTVTVLTSMDASDLAELGYSKTSVEELVLFRARKALEAGCDGVIASGHEVQRIKEMAAEHLSGKTLLVVTPGIRPDGYPEDDQKRKVTPRQAVLSGADYVVIGRPITAAKEPRDAAETIIQEMQHASDSLGPSTT